MPRVPLAQAQRSGQRWSMDFIRSGKPTENGYIESFNGKLRDELLNTEIFFSLNQHAHSNNTQYRYSGVTPIQIIGKLLQLESESKNITPALLQTSASWRDQLKADGENQTSAPDQRCQMAG